MTEAAHEQCSEREEIVLEWGGVVDVSRARELLDHAKACLVDSRDVVVRCDALERIDASGLQILLAMRCAVEASGGRLRLAGLPAPIAASLLRAGASALAATERTAPDTGPAPDPAGVGEDASANGTASADAAPATDESAAPGEEPAADDDAPAAPSKAPAADDDTESEVVQ